MVYAAKYLDEQTSCDVIDINMGCPVPKVVNNNGGSALMKDPGYVEELVKAMVSKINKPLTVKMRAGWDEEHINVCEVAKACEKGGASLVCIHPRTRTQYYAGHSNWDLIREVKEIVNIPVLGNGDIHSIDDMIEMERVTGCDGFMVARGALGNPWLIQQLVHYDLYGERLAEPTPFDKIEQCLQHAQRLMAIKPEINAIKEMRGHACWYINGLPNNNKVKAKINDITTYKQLEEIMGEYDKALRSEDYSYFL